MTNKSKAVVPRRRFLLPAALLLAALLVGVSALRPAVFATHAATNDGNYVLTVKAEGAGTFTVTVPDNGDLVGSFDDQAGWEDYKTVNDNSATYSIFLDGSCQFDLTSPVPITSLSLGDPTGLVTVIDALNASLSDLKINGATTALRKLFVNDLAFDKAYALSLNSEEGVTVYSGAPEYDLTDDGVILMMPELTADTKVFLFGEESDLALEPNAEGKYFFSFDTLKSLNHASEEYPAVSMKLVKGNVEYVVELLFTAEDISGGDTSEDPNPDDPDDPFEHIGAFGPAKNSEKVLLSVGIDNEIVVKNGSQVVGLADVRAAVKAPSDKEKKAFLEAIKKADKNFAATDNDLMVYEVYLTDEKGNTLTIAEGGVTSVLFRYAFPESQLYADEYTYKVYQQLANKSAASIDTLQATGHGLNFYTETLGLFAVARTPIPVEYTDLTIREDSRNIIKAAQIDKTASLCLKDGVSIDLKDVCIAAVKPSDADKKTFLEAIRKTDKDFKSDDKNLMVYDICLVDKDNKEVYSNRFIKITLLYPNDTVAKSYNGYTYKVYHDHGETIDTKITATGAKDGITFSSKEFSLYAISSTVKQSGGDGNPGTGETNALTVIAFVLAALSVIGFAVVYTKNKAEQV